jgi:glutamate synthase domain-containing protein 1
MITKPTKEIETLKEQETRMLQALSNITIATQEDYDNVANLGKKVSAYIKSIDTKEKSITKPINDSLKSIRDLFRPFKEVAEAKKEEIKSVMVAFVRAEEAKRKLEEERISKRVEKGTMREDTAVTKLASIEESTVVTTGTTTSVLKMTVLSIKDIPEEYLIVNEAKLKEAYRAGIEVSGVSFTYETNIRL